MKKILLVLLFISLNILYAQPEMYIYIWDDPLSQWFFNATKYDNSPVYDLYGNHENTDILNYAEQDTFITNASGSAIVTGFDFIGVTNPFPGRVLGRGIYRINLYRATEINSQEFIKMFTFIFDYRKMSSLNDPIPDVEFKLSKVGSSYIMTHNYWNYENGILVEKYGQVLENNATLRIWELLDEPRNWEPFVKQAVIKNDFNGSVNPNIDCTLTDKSEGFPYPAYPDYEKGHIFHPNDVVTFWKGATYEFQVTDAVVNNCKAHHWTNYWLYGNEGELSISSTLSDITCYFTPVVQLLVTNNLEGASGGTYDLTWKEPMIELKNLNSGSPNYVFQYQEGNVNSYKIKLKQSFDINSSTWSFINWSDEEDNVSLEREITLTANASYTANYKASLCTDASGNFAYGSQRKMVRTDNGYLHVVYESMGKVWYEMSTNNGSSWSLVCWEGLFEIGAKSPSLDYLGNKVFLVLHNQYNKIMLYVFENGSYVNDLEIAKNTNYMLYTTPVVACGGTNQFAVVWNSGSGIKYSYGNIVNSIVGFNSSGQITGTSSSSMYSTAAAKNETGSLFHLHIAWQELLSNSTYKIFYMDYLSNSNNTALLPQLSSPYCVSYGCGYTHCFVPSVTALSGGDVIVGWSAARSSSGVNPGDPVDKESGFETSLSEWKAIYKKKNNGQWESAFHVYGDNVSSVNVNKAGLNFAMCYYIGQNASRYVKSTGNSISPITTAGSNPQLSNGIDFAAMRSAAYDRTVTPRRINISTAGLSKLNSENYISRGREGVVFIDTLQFFFALGDLIVDNTQINFVDYPDSMDIVTLDTLNKYVISEPFQLNDNSNFIYSVIYGYSDSLAAINMFGENNIAFKVKLIDAATGEVIGVYDEVTYSSQGVFPYAAFLYNVNTAGIGNRIVRLKLETTTGLNASYSFSDRASDNSPLAKLMLTNKRFDGTPPIDNYALMQNYPNPFNPMTTITYELPKNDYVTIKVYDILGREVSTLIDKFQNAGRYKIVFNGSHLASGVYIYSIRTNNFTDSKKFILMK